MQCSNKLENTKVYFLPSNVTERPAGKILTATEPNATELNDAHAPAKIYQNRFCMQRMHKHMRTLRK